MPHRSRASLDESRAADSRDANPTASPATVVSGAAPNLECSTDQMGDVFAISVVGEWDIAAAESFPVLNGEASGTVLLDLSGLTFMDSTGLRTILSTDKACRDAGGQLLLIPGPPCVQKVFSITRTEEGLNFFTPGVSDIVE